MLPGGAHPADRAGDARTVIAGLQKPTVLSRAAVRWLCLACLAGIVYGTLGPLGLADGPWLVPVATWAWRPPWGTTDLNDLVTNLAVYFPVGIALRLLVRRRGWAGWPDFCVGVLLSAALSYVTEVLQQAMPARSSNMIDVCVNTLAAGAGCAVAVQAQRGLRRAHALVFAQARVRWRRWALLAGGTAGLAALLMTAPWRLGPPAFSWDWDGLWCLSGLRRGVLFAVCGFFTAGALRLRGGGTPGAALIGLVLTSALAAGIEAAQTVCRGHVATAGHALSAALAGVVGCAVGALYAAPARQHYARFPLRWIAGAALVALVVYRAGTAVAALTVCVPGEPVVHWAPFQAEFTAPFWIAFAEALEQLTVNGLITLACLFAARRGGEAAALLLVLGCAAGLELVRALGGAGAHTTPLVLAAAGWLVSVRAWHAVFPAQGLHQPRGT